MLGMLEAWKGSIEINGTVYEGYADIPQGLTLQEGWTIKLLPKTQKKDLSRNTETQTADKQEYFITVKKYMTQKATPEFDFMSKWNHNCPMPLVTMAGYVIKETKGMVYMKLHGMLQSEQMIRCMCCGRTLTNPISRYIGLGPECGKVIHMSLTEQDKDNIDEMVKEAKERLEKVEWEGWVIRSAIKEMVEI